MARELRSKTPFFNLFSRKSEKRFKKKRKGTTIELCLIVPPPPEEETKSLVFTPLILSRTYGTGTTPHNSTQLNSTFTMTTDRKVFEDAFFHHIEENTDLYVQRLAEAVAIPSISSDLVNHLKDIEEMMHWTKDHIERLNGKATLLPNPSSTPEKTYPPILIGEFMVDPKKKTVCVYGHLDVQPAAIEDGWDSDPFVLTERDGQLFGRGSTDDKGPALSWLWVVEAHQHLGIELPVNVKLIYEGMEVSDTH